MKTGYCSVCKRDDIKRLNQAIEDGWSYGAVRETFSSPPAKATFFKHKEHLKSPLQTTAERAHTTVSPKTNREVLEAIRDIGLQNAMDDPSRINANHAIRAAGILAEKEKTHRVEIVLAELLQGPPPAIALEDTIDGEYEVINGNE